MAHRDCSYSCNIKFDKPHPKITLNYHCVSSCLVYYAAHRPQTLIKSFNMLVYRCISCLITYTWLNIEPCHWVFLEHVNMNSFTMALKSQAYLLCVLCLSRLSLLNVLTVSWNRLCSLPFQLRHQSLPIHRKLPCHYSWKGCGRKRDCRLIWDTIIFS